MIVPDSVLITCGLSRVFTKLLAFLKYANTTPTLSFDS